MPRGAAKKYIYIDLTHSYVGPWAGGVTSLSLSFLIYLMGIHLAHTSKYNVLKFF